MKKQIAGFALSLSVLAHAHALTPEVDGYNMGEYAIARTGVEQLEAYVDSRAQLVEMSVTGALGGQMVFDLEDKVLKLMSSTAEIQREYVRAITHALVNNENMPLSINLAEKEQLDGILTAVIDGHYGEAADQLYALRLNATTQLGKTIAFGLSQNNWASGYLEYVQDTTVAHDMSSEEAGEAIGTVAGAYVGLQIGGSVGVIAGGPGGLVGGAVGGGGLGAVVGGAIGKLIGGLFGKKDKDKEEEGDGGDQGDGEQEGFWLGERGDQPGCGQFGVNC